MDEDIVFWIVIGILGFLGVLIILVPIAGLTVRFALKPMMESIAKFRDVQGQAQATQLLERRLALVEERLVFIEQSSRPVPAGELEGRLDPALEAPTETR